VADALLVYDNEILKAPQNIEIDVSDEEVVAGPDTSVKIKLYITDVMGRPVGDGTPVIVSTDLGMTEPRYETKNGQVLVQLSNLRIPGQAHVKALCGVACGHTRISVIPGEPDRVISRITKTENHGEYQVELLLCDSSLNPVSTRLLLIDEFSGKGHPEPEEVVTGRDGVGGFLWKDGTPGDIFKVTLANQMVFRGVISPGITEMETLKEVEDD
ncbi:MAG: hypothetical protein J7M18_00380, partial [Candidatus Eremiobacteraeota bacterium]|nr:hypothetical protein [Candidatus Eremiobacteraeota bacterium]